MITARREDGLRDAAGQVDGAEWFVATAGRREDAQAAVAECIDRLGALDILVNNAATNPYAGNVIDIDRARADSCSTAAWRSRG